MNTLPLVFAFVIVIALTAYNTFYDFASCIGEEKKYSAFMKAHRQLQTNLDKKQFRSNKGKLVHGSREKSESKNEAKYHNPRDKVTLHPLSKLNILPLLAADNAHETPFYEITAHLIALLYQNSAVYEVNLEYKVLDLLIKEAKKDKEFTFETLTQNVLQRDSSLYKLFKGTKNYQLQSHKGYPPLADFIIVEAEKSKRPVHFHYATTPILLAVLGEKLTAAVAAKEKEKWEKDNKHHSLNAQELEAIFIKQQSKTPFSAVEILIDFSKKNIPNPNTTVIDPKSEISLSAKKS